MTILAEAYVLLLIQLSLLGVFPEDASIWWAIPVALIGFVLWKATLGNIRNE